MAEKPRAAMNAVQRHDVSRYRCEAKVRDEWLAAKLTDSGCRVTERG